MCVQPSTPKPSKGSCVCLILQALLVPFASNKPEQSQSSSSKQDMTGKRDVSCVMGHITHSLGTHKSTFCYKNIQPALFKGFFLLLSEYHLPKAAKQKEAEQPNKGMFVSYQQFVQQGHLGFPGETCPFLCLMLHSEHKPSPTARTDKDRGSSSPNTHGDREGTNSKHSSRAAMLQRAGKRFPLRKKDKAHM